jgi:hypothetical protein
MVGLQAGENGARSVARLRWRRFHILADAANASPSPFANRGITSL